jgi:hypothetical protein
MGAMTEQRASEWDKEYFRRIGEWKAETKAQQRRDHLALPLDQRLLASEQLYQWSKGYANPRSEPKDMGAIFERARRLGILPS